QIPVALTIWTEPISPLTVSPAAITSISPAGVGGGDYLCINTGNFNVAFDVRVIGNWLNLSLDNPITDTCGSLNCIAGLPPGTYPASIVVSIPGQSVTVPVTLTVRPPPEPSIGSVVNAASSVEGAVAPGEIITIHGIGVGPLPYTQPND